MKNLRKGDIVVRKSYGKDILFIVENIIDTIEGKKVIISGVNERIEADSNICDLEIVEKKVVKNILKQLDKKIDNINKMKHDNYKIGIVTTKENRLKQKIITGKILHLDGDKRYSQKSYRYYQKLGLNAVVKNIPEYKQPIVIYRLLKIYNPDILIVTGHDGMLKKGTGYNDIYNYRNSKHFIQTVKEARKYDAENKNNLVIFAGACQSYFEAIMSAGADFASSPARILIDFLDPLIIAEKVATTDRYKYITIDEIAKELKDGKEAVGGIGARGKKTLLIE
jgi:spore coat assembly protein